jgi:hypothetical protein
MTKKTRKMTVVTTLKARVQPKAHAREGVEGGDPAVDPFMDPHLSNPEKAPLKRI